MDKGLTCCLSLSEKYDGEYYKVKAPSLNLTIKNHSDKVIDLPIGSEKIRILIRGDNNFCTFSQMCVNNINPTTIKLYPDKEIVLFSSLFYGTDKTDKGLELPPGEYRIQGVYDGYLYSNVVDVMVEKL